MKNIVLFLLLTASFYSIPVKAEGVLPGQADYPYLFSEKEAVVKMSELSNLHINAFCQDSLGYMWIATSRGLNKYNGYEYIHYFHEKENENSLPNDHVTTLFLDSRNLLWIGTNAGMGYYDSRKDLFIRCYIEGDLDPRCVYRFVEDKQGRIWVCMMDGLGLVSSLDERGKRVLDYQEMDPALGVFKNLETDNQGSLWVTMEKGLLKYNISELSYRIVHQTGDDVIQDFHLDQSDVCWLATDRGLRWIDGKSGKVKALPESFAATEELTKEGISRISPIAPGRILIATDNRLYIYDQSTRQLNRVNERNLDPVFDLQKITSCFVDSFGNIWIGTFNKGYTVLYQNRKRFNQDTVLSDLLKDKFVTAICAPPNADDLWIGTRYDGLYRYNRKTKKHIHYDQDNCKLFEPVHNSFIQSLYFDTSGRLWVGLTEGACVLTFGHADSFSCQYLKDLGGVVTFAEDKEHKIWIGSEQSGLFVYSDLNKEPVHIRSERSTNVTRILPLSNGKMLVSFFSDNVFMMDCNTFERFSVAEPDTVIDGILRACITMCETSPGTVWMGSYSSGMATINMTTGEYSVYDSENGLPSNDVLGIAPDAKAHLWLSTSFGLSRFDPDEGKFRNFFTNDGTLGNQYHEKACFKTSDQTIFMGGNHGLTFFDPLQIVLDTLHPVVVLENLKILNQHVKPSEGDVLEAGLEYTENITLNHRQNVFTIDYATIGFTGSRKYVYAYKMEGMDKDWNYVGGYRRASYSNLSPGNYTFKVRVQNEEGIWSDRYAMLNIQVKAAPWLTGWAYLVYLFILLFVIYMFFRLSVSIKVSKMSLDLLKKDQQREQQLTEMKIKFFNNISHELQTPLSLIYGPLSVMLKKNHTDSEQHLLSIIEMNVSRLLKLINQLLDFGKMESDTLELKVRNQDIVVLLQQIKKRFEYYARQKNITFSFYTSDAYYISYFDEDKIDKIMNNLLSNAFKYTPVNGEVDIHVRTLTAREVSISYGTEPVNGTDYLEITVSDSGPGISKEEISGLFGRYKRLTPKVGEKDAYTGTGLGLSYTKSLVSIHKGYIRAAEGEQKGMSFSFVVPLGKGLYDSKEISRDIKQEEDLVKCYPSSLVLPVPNVRNGSEAEDTSDKPYTLLIVDDDPGIQDFVKFLLHKKYNILQAFNAADGYQLLKDEAPDLVITDVLMPGMNGYDFCRKIKTNQELSHVAVIILTAKGRLDEHIEGLSAGADAYVNKPFDETYLLTVIDNLIRNRERLKGVFHAGSIPEGESLSAIDRKFMENLYQLLDERLDEVELNVNNLSRELAFSRSSFYRKIKALTGESPNTFVRIYRLNKAKELLSDTEMTIGEVATATGFSTLSHFSSCFKKQFGVSPTDFKNK